MLFRPSFCAHCGEKIERAEWHLWTSRRFCEVCATEFRGVDLLPKIAAGTGLLGIVLAVSGYVGRGPTNPAPLAAKQVSRTSERTAANTAVPIGPQPVASPATERPAAANAPSKVPQLLAPGLQAGGSDKPEGPVYFCGAQTKKGTPCSRRVKGNVRCFQHTGMPAMLPPEKLRVS